CPRPLSLQRPSGCPRAKRPARPSPTGSGLPRSRGPPTAALRQSRKRRYRGGCRRRRSRFLPAGALFPPPPARPRARDPPTLRPVELVDLVVELFELLAALAAQAAVGEADLLHGAARLRGRDLPRGELLDDRLGQADDGPLLGADERPGQLGRRLVDAQGNL